MPPMCFRECNMMRITPDNTPHLITLYRHRTNQVLFPCFKLSLVIPQQKSFKSLTWTEQGFIIPTKRGRLLWDIPKPFTRTSPKEHRKLAHGEMLPFRSSFIRVVFTQRYEDPNEELDDSSSFYIENPLMYFSLIQQADISKVYMENRYDETFRGQVKVLWPSTLKVSEQGLCYWQVKC